MTMVAGDLVAAGRYRVVRQVGKGAMGVVFEAENVRIRRKVALKCLLPSLSADPDVVKRFEAEALAATAIGNPHIVDVLDMDRAEDGTCFLVLELLEGHDLRDELEETGPLRIERALRIGAQIADALAAAHAIGIVHRDVKPANVFLIRRGEDPDFVKLLDFGVAKFVETVTGQGSWRTRPGAIIGTVPYMAPEQVQGSAGLDHRIDVYALGVILYELLAGKRPFDAPSLDQLFRQICFAAPAPLCAAAPEASAELELLVSRMLAKQPGARPGSAAEVRAELLRLAGPNVAQPQVDRSALASADTLVAGQARAALGTMAATDASGGSGETLAPAGHGVTEETPMFFAEIPGRPTVPEMPSPIPAQPTVLDMPASIPTQPTVAEMPSPIPMQPTVAEMPAPIPMQALPAVRGSVIRSAERSRSPGEPLVQAAPRALLVTRRGDGPPRPRLDAPNTRAPTTAAARDRRLLWAFLAAAGALLLAASAALLWRSIGPAHPAAPPSATGAGSAPVLEPPPVMPPPPSATATPDVSGAAEPPAVTPAAQAPTLTPSTPTLMPSGNGLSPGRPR